MALQAQVLQLNKGLGERISPGALPTGFLAECKNVFYSSGGLLHLYRPAWSSVASLTSNQILDAKIFLDKGIVAILTSAEASIFDLSGNLVATYSLNASTAGEIALLADEVLFASSGNPLVAYSISDSKFRFCGSIYSSEPSTTAGVTIGTVGDSSLVQLGLTRTAEKRIRFVRVWLARKLHTTGVIRAKVVTDVGTHSSYNVVYIGAVPHIASSSEMEFGEYMFYFEDAICVSQCNVYLTTESLEHPDGTPEVYIAAEYSSLKPSYVTINASYAACQVNGRRNPEGLYVIASGFGRCFLGDHQENEVLVSAVNNPDDFDSDEAGWFGVGFSPKVIMIWLNALLVSGDEKLEAYAGNWPNDIQQVSSYGNPVANKDAWFVSDARLYFVSRKRLLKASPLDKVGTLDFEEIRANQILGKDAKLTYLPGLGLLVLSASYVDVMQLATGQWSEWEEFPFVELNGDYAVGSDGTLYRLDLEPALVPANVTVKWPTLFFGLRMVPKQLLFAHRLPADSTISLARNTCTISYDLWSTSSEPPIELQPSVVDLIIGAAAEAASGLILEIADNIDEMESCDIELVVPAGKSNEPKLSLATAVLRYLPLSDEKPVGG